MQTLVLNATYEINKIVSWKRAITLYMNDKVDILEEYDRFILTPSLKIKVPAVIKFKRVVKRPKFRDLKFNRLNVYARDSYICQYCYKQFLRHKLTLDHIIPKSRGGPSSWINCVTCCKKCNVEKADRTPKEANMKLFKQPRQPSHVEGLVLNIKLNTDGIPEVWKKYALPDV